MNRRISRIAMIGLLLLLLPLNGGGVTTRMKDQLLIINHINLIPMTTNRVLPDKTIIIKMDRFEEMSKHPAMKYQSFMQKFFLRQSVKSLETLGKNGTNASLI